MNRLTRLVLRAGLLTVALWAPFVGAAEIPGWFDAGASNEANAEAAQRANASPGQATDALIRLGGEPVDSVRSVVEAYDTCAALYESVSAGVGAAPAQGADIAAAVAAMDGCPCSAENEWARSRLEKRMRMPRRAVPVTWNFACACTASAAEAAINAAPELADEVFGRLAQSGQVGSMGESTPTVVDVLGQVNPGEQAAGVLDAGESAWVRRPDACDQRTDPYETFSAGQEFDRAPGTSEYRASCRGTVGNVLISRYLQMPDGVRAVELSNLTDEAVDLGAQGLQLELFAGNEREPKSTVALRGKIAAGGRYVLTTPNAPAAMRESADEVTGDIFEPRADALVLRRPKRTRDDTDCECAASAFAGAVNGLGAGSKVWVDQTREKAEMAVAGQSGPTVVDALGQINPGAGKEGMIDGSGMAWVRRPDSCEQRTDPYGAFEQGKEFDRAAGAPDYRAGNCGRDVSNVLISRYLQMPDGARAVELSNLTGEPIELSDTGLRLELFAENERDPQRVVPLDGRVDPGDSFLIATPDAPAEIRERADLVTPDISMPRADALVLRQLGGGNDVAACPADVVALAKLYPEGPVLIVPPDIADLDGPPRTDESIIDPDRGGDLASPN